MGTSSGTDTQQEDPDLRIRGKTMSIKIFYASGVGRNKAEFLNSH